MDTLRQWQRTYSRELDSDAKQQCVATERLLRKALAGGGEAFTSSTVQPRFAFKKNILSDTVPPPPHTYLCLTQCPLLRPRPRRSMRCRTASCLMLRCPSRCCPLTGAAPPAKTGPGPTGAQRWRQDPPAPNGGRAAAQRSGTKPEEQRLLSCTG